MRQILLFPFLFAMTLGSAQPFDRTAAWQRTIVYHNEGVPNAAFTTYSTEGMDAAHQWILAKINPAIEGFSAADATEVTVADYPGGIDASWKWDDVRVSVKWAPVLSPRADSEWSGAAVYRIATDPPTPVSLRVGGGFRGWFHLAPIDFMMNDEVDFDGATAVPFAGNETTILLTSANHPLQVIAHAASGQAAVLHQHGRVSFPEGRGELHLSFAETAGRARELAQPRKALEEVEAYYGELLRNAYIETPEDELDAAFASAIIVNEYCWFEPFGWIEGVHHWVTLWHQQHVGMAHWLGQHERARRTNLETARRQFENGAIPHLQPTGRTRRDFGGANQYFAWQILQYYRKTGDGDLVKELAPTLRASLANTLREYDPEGNGLIGWGLQIGNQEDFVSTPYDGAAPSAELLNIIESVRLAEELLGNIEEAQRLEARKEHVARLIRQRLVHPDLARPIYMIDHGGEARLDGQYHSLIYPVLSGILSPELEYTTVRHLLDRLTGRDGETYLSNNFADHLPELWSTWGMQAGAAQQPWAAFAYNRLGMTEQAIKPLRWIANVVHNDIQRGTWPEVAHEQRPGYFSPPAALYVQAVIESIFGLQPNLPGGILTIRPCFPDKWKDARLVLPEYSAEFARDGETWRYRITSDRALAREVRWPVTLGAKVEVKANGLPVAFDLRPGVGGATVWFSTAPEKETRLELRVEPSQYTPPALPGSMSVSEAVARGDLSAPRVLELAKDYGRLGQINFSRRTLFQPHLLGGTTPHDYLLLPDYAAAAQSAQWHEDQLRLEVLVRNNTDRSVNGQASARGFGGAFATATVAISPHSESTVTFTWSEEEIQRFAPGEEQIALTLPRGSADFTAVIPLAENRSLTYHQIELPKESRVGDDDYLSWRNWHNGHTDLWRSPVSPLHDLKQMDLLESADLPGVVFPGPIEKLAVVASDENPLVIPVERKEAVHKVYLLTCAFVNNHEIFSQIAEVELVHPIPQEGPPSTRFGQPRTLRRLHYPGDLDAFYPEGTLARVSTFSGRRPDRHGLLPLLGAGEADWPTIIAKPPAFPQDASWSDSAVISTANAIFNIIEITPETALPVERVVVRAIAADAVLGVAGVLVATDPD